MADPTDLVVVRSPALTASINPLGSELHTLQDAEGRDLLWDGDPAYWTGRAPILFPIIGMLNGGAYRLGDRTYTLPKHGFARRKRFEVVSQEAASVVFRLEQDEETLAHYPFSFRLDIAFTIQGSALLVEASLSHPGSEPLPASLGFHPALRWPLPYDQPRAAHHVQFDLPQEGSIRRIDAHGLVLPEAQPSPVAEKTLPLRDDLFTNDAVIFDPFVGGGLLYGAGEGPRLRLDCPDTPYLGVWTKPGAPYICLEPWHGMADPVGYEGDFRQKPGVFEVAPGETRRMGYALTLQSEGLPPGGA